VEIDINLLCELFRYRWDAPILAELRRSEGCKYVTLRHRLSVADVPMRQALDFLILKGWVMRNPGYGHPSRPEYVLTDSGALLADRCDATLQALNRLGVEQIGLNRWSLPILCQLTFGPARFSELQRSISTVSPRSLTQSLRSLIDHGLAARSVSVDMPVVVAYSLTDDGHNIASIWQ